MNILPLLGISVSELPGGQHVPLCILPQEQGVPIGMHKAIIAMLICPGQWGLQAYHEHVSQQGYLRSHVLQEDVKGELPVPLIDLKGAGHCMTLPRTTNNRL